jgi:hypothetical protein
LTHPCPAECWALTERVPVLDVVFIAGILALIALVAAVGKGVERL